MTSPLALHPVLSEITGENFIPEIFPSMGATEGLLNRNGNMLYLAAFDEYDTPLGAIGFYHDAIEMKISILELLTDQPEVKGDLIASLVQIACEDLEVYCIEADVSAYSPSIQRTFERIGFVPTAYIPSLFPFKKQRLDAIHMVQINEKYDIKIEETIEEIESIGEIVDKISNDRFEGMEITEEVRKNELFSGAPEGDLYHLARIAVLKKYEKGTQIISKGDEAYKLYVLAKGEAEIHLEKGKVASIIPEKSIFGEMALLEKTPRTADVILTKNSEVIEIEAARLNLLLEKRSRLGHIVSKNLAKSLSKKLRNCNSVEIL